MGRAAVAVLRAMVGEAVRGRVAVAVVRAMVAAERAVADTAAGAMASQEEEKAAGMPWAAMGAEAAYRSWRSQWTSSGA